MSNKEPHKSGFVSIIGKPNAGKSTLLNQILGKKLSITTAKAQTTRHRIFGIDSGENHQIVYSDTPGLIRPKYALQTRMMGFVGSALEDADMIILLIAVNETFPEEDIVALAQKTEIPKLLVLNKVDAVEQHVAFARMQELASKLDFVEAIPISALKGTNVEVLKGLIMKYLPEGPAFFDKEQFSDRPERFFIAEIVREKLFERLKDELPYSTEVVIDKFEEEDRLIRINATIHVERKTQKGIVIGKGGSMLKLIGSLARKDIESFLGKQVYLELYVKVSSGWKNSDFHLGDFGY